MEPDTQHGVAGSGLGSFSRLLPQDTAQPSFDLLRSLADQMCDAPDTPNDAPDPEENLAIPAGYTYLAQFVDHDLTFDTTSTLDPLDKTSFTNARSPRFDLDNVYGGGPDTSPFMYTDGIRLVDAGTDLPRAPANKRAIIGDPRNDENSIVCNLQMAFIKFHNAAVDRLETDLGISGKPLFKRAQQEVRWTYQRILVDDFLPRIVSHETLYAFEVRRDPSSTGLSRNESAYALFTRDKRGAIPIEFSGAVYRFGHSMVRNGYRLSTEMPKPLSIFLVPPRPPRPPVGPGLIDSDNSLIGFAPLPPLHVITDWSRFFPNPATAGAVAKAGEWNATNEATGPGRLQYSYRLDTTLGEPMAHLPKSVAGSGEVEFRLAARNLMRGAKFQLASGQSLASTLGVPEVPSDLLRVRVKPVSDASPDGDTDKQSFVKIHPDLLDKTPLWFYVLAEAQMPMTKWALERAAQGHDTFTEDELLEQAGKITTQLGEAGGRVVLEVFHGLLDADSDSYRNSTMAGGWNPLIKDFTMWSLVNRLFRA